jgi:hypothetical protein
MYKSNSATAHLLSINTDLNSVSLPNNSITDRVAENIAVTVAKKIDTTNELDGVGEWRVVLIV